MKRYRPEGHVDKEPKSTRKKDTPKAHHYIQRVGADVEQLNMFIKNFDVSVSETEIREELEKRNVLEILDIRIPRHFDNHPKPFAYVTFGSVQTLTEAIDLCQDITVNGRKWFVAKSKPTKDVYEPNILFVTGFKDGISEEDAESVIRDLVAEIQELNETEVAEIRCRSNPKKGLFYAYVEFNDKVDHLFEQEMHRTLQGQNFVIKRSIPKKDHRWQVPPKPKGMPPPDKPVKPPPTDTLFVKNLPWKVKENELEEFLEDHGGPVLQVKFIRDEKTKKSKGMAYVQMENANSISTILSLNGCEFKGRSLNIERSDREITTKIIRPAMDLKEQRRQLQKTKDDDEEGDEEDEGGEQTGMDEGLANILSRLTEKNTSKKIEESVEKANVKPLQHVEKGRVRVKEEVPLSDRAGEEPLTNEDFRKMFLG